jgi:NTP pyrophosphatase (non-canonical NTP hydrolase)
VLGTVETAKQQKNNLHSLGAQIIFVALMKDLITKAHQVAKDKGFWDTERNVSEMLMLIVSEVAEAQEALRKNHYAEKSIADGLQKDLELNSSDEEFKMDIGIWKSLFEEKIKSSFEDEIADVAIRLFDLCGGMGIDLEKHIELKMKYNSMRGYKHGKAF